MKTTIFIALMSIFACMTVNAENKEINNKVAEPTENNITLQYPNMIAESNVASMMSDKSDKGYRQDRYWKHGRNLRTVGIITTVAGVLGGPFLLLAAGNELGNSKSGQDAVDNTTLTLGAAALGGTIIIGGIVMWAIGNSSMRHARLSYTGNGLAYNF